MLPKLYYLCRALMTDLRNINDPIMSFNESDLLHVILYKKQELWQQHEYKYTDCNYQIYQRHWKVWSTSF